MPVPTGYTQSAAVAMVRLRTNEPNLPSAANLVTLLNAALEQVALEISPIIANATINVTAGTTSVPLPQDVQQVLAVYYSTVAPFTAGWQPYEVQPFSYENFQDTMVGSPIATGGPAWSMAVLTDTAGVMTLQLGAATSAGYLFVLYTQRPTLWDASAPNSTTNMDTAFQECAILRACQMLCESLDGFNKAQYFKGLYDEQLEKARNTARRRFKTAPAQVRDVLTGPAIGPWPRG